MLAKPSVGPEGATLSPAHSLCSAPCDPPAWSMEISIRL
jgi:hypothetical protein